MMYTIKKENITLELEPFTHISDLIKRKTEMLRIKVRSYRFYAEAEFPANASLLAEFAEALNRLYETLDGKAELEGMGSAYNCLSFSALHTGVIRISGTLSMHENNLSHEMTFSYSVDQTFFRDFAKALYKDYAAH